MPRIAKALPSDRSDYSFGDLVYWHLFVYGTRPTGDPDAAAGREWEAGAFCDLLGIADRTLRYWIADKHFPDSTAALAGELFGDNPKFDAWRLELAEALRVSRQRKVRKSADNGAADTTGLSEDETIDTEANDPSKPPRDEHHADAHGGGTTLGDSDERPHSRSTALVPYAQRRGDDARPGRGISTIHLDWSTRPSGYRHRAFTRRSATAVVSGLVVLIGLYAWTRPSPENPSRTPPPSSQPEPAPSEPKKEAKHQPTDEKPTVAIPSPEETKPKENAPPKVDAPKVDAPKPEPPKAEPQPAPDPKQAEAAARAAEKQRIEQEAAAARQQAFDDAQRARDAEAHRQDGDPDPEATAARNAQDRRDKDARAIAGAGYRLIENNSAIGVSLGHVPAETVTECAQSCSRENCDAFTFPAKPRAGKDNYCFRYKAPVGFRPDPSSRSGQRIADAPTHQLAAAEPGAAAAPTVTAQATPAAPTAEKPDGLTRCANGVFKVAGFKLSCDRILGGGTTLGSAQLRYTVATINECAAKCRTIARCVGFTFNAADPDGQHSCEIFGPTPEMRDVGGYVSGTR